MDQSPSETTELHLNVPVSLSLDEGFEALADQHRRQLLVVLQRSNTAERLSTLARSLAVEAGTPDAGTVDHLHAHLYHVHVPKLAAAGLVTYDDEALTVELTEEGRTVAEALAQ